MPDTIKTAKELIAEEYGFKTAPTVAKKESSIKVYKGKAGLDRFNFLKKKYGNGITTGYGKLDNYFTFLPQQLYLLSSPTHHGKTLFSMNMASRIATLGFKVLYVSLEQGVFVSQFVEKILEGPFPDNLWILDTSDMLLVEELLNAINQLEEKPDMVMIDHIHFLKKKGRGATEDIDEIILKLQNMAKELEIPVLAISHLRKLNSDKPPELDDLRDSSSLSQVPSVVMFIYRQKDLDMSTGYLSNNGTLFIPKNRIQGKTGAEFFVIEPSGKIEFPNTLEDSAKRIGLI